MPTEVLQLPAGQSWPLTPAVKAQDISGKPGPGGHQKRAPGREVRIGFAKTSLWLRKLLRHRQTEGSETWIGYEDTSPTQRVHLGETKQASPRVWSNWTSSLDRENICPDESFSGRFKKSYGCFKYKFKLKVILKVFQVNPPK